MTKDDYLSFGCDEVGKPLLRVQMLALIAKAVGIQFKIGGQPYGASYEHAINQQAERRIPRSGLAQSRGL